MKLLFTLVGVLLAAMLLFPQASAGTIIHSNGNFTGEFFNTTLDGNNITLANDTVLLDYYLYGNYTSPVLDAGSVVNWESLSWKEVLPLNTNITVSIRMGNTSSPDSEWGNFFNNVYTPVNITGSSRYIQYVTFLTTSDSSFTPFLEELSLSYSKILPEISLDNPINNFISTEPNATFTCSAHSPNNLFSIGFYSDYTGTWILHEVVSVSGENASVTFSISNVSDGEYEWNCAAADVLGQTASNPINYTIIFSSSNEGPAITHLVEPDLVAIGENVTLSIAATDSNGVDSVWAEITTPNSSKSNISLINEGEVNYTAELEGIYLVTFYANDTLGYTTSVSDSFTAAPEITFNFSANNNNQSALNATFKVLKNGEVIASSEGGVEQFSVVLLEDIYDLSFAPESGEFNVVLRGVDISTEQGKSLGLDWIGDFETYSNMIAVSNPYNIASATVEITYSDSDFDNESFIQVYECSSWNFDTRTCTTGVFSLVSLFDHDLDANTITFNVTGFSSFGFGQDSYCGDGVCSSEESVSSCPEDCQCVAGATRTCGETDVGECEFGTQTCSNGEWGTCIDETTPIIEVCNGKDDDCDSVVDNIGGGSSVASTLCGCFGGASPSSELCNNIDDDCDGEIDVFEQVCGSNIGACETGMKTCTSGVFGDCVGGIMAAADEICGNLIDDDCDNDVNEGCPNCFNGLQDGDEEGVDCGGSCATSCSPDLLPIISIAVVIVILALLALFYLRFKQKKSSWKEVEKRYSYKP